MLFCFLKFCLLVSDREMFNIDKKVDCKIIMEKEIQLLAKIGEYQFMQK